MNDEDKKFYSLLDQKRYKDLSDSMNRISGMLETKDNKDFVDVINKQSEIITSFVSNLKQGDNGANLAAITKMSQDVIAGQAKVEKSLNDLIEQGKIMHEWNFNVKRGGFDNSIETVNAKQVK